LFDIYRENEEYLAEADRAQMSDNEVQPTEVLPTGHTVGQVILRELDEVALDKKTFVGQAYDGTAYMSSKTVGAAT